MNFNSDTDLPTVQPLPSGLPPKGALPPMVPQNSSNLRAKILPLIAITVVILVAMVGYFVYKNRKVPAVNTPESQQFSANLHEYPDAYTIAKLPQYPGATVNISGRKEATVQEGNIRFILSTSDNLSELMSFYDKQLAGLDWQKQADTNSSDSAPSTYTKDNLQLQLKFSDKNLANGDHADVVVLLTERK